MKEPLAWCCKMETRNFSFTGYGATEIDANESLGRAIKEHARQYQLADNWADVYLDDCPTFPIYARGYRDSEPIA